MVVSVDLCMSLPLPVCLCPGLQIVSDEEVGEGMCRIAVSLGDTHVQALLGVESPEEVSITQVRVSFISIDQSVIINPCRISHISFEFRFS